MEPPVDPWGTVYLIRPKPDNPEQPLVLSCGPDGVEGTEDDITNETIIDARAGTDSTRPR